MPAPPRRDPSALPDPASQSRDGSLKAMLFRQYRLPAEVRDRRRCDLEPILEEDHLEVCESELTECGYTACLLRMPDGGGGIMIAAGQDPGRRRFSLAHELGHYHIPKHKDVGLMLSCADADLRARASDARQLEWEANDFATELLMPRRLFAQDVAGREATFRTVRELAGPEMYDVSLTAAAWRLIQTSREACALVVSTDGQVEWIVRSEAWHYPLAERRRPLPSGSVAAAVARGEAPNPYAESLDPPVWLASSDGRWVAPGGLEMFESTHAVPRLRQVVSLLWVVSSDD